MNLDLPGFADPATESQHCFRALLDAMSRPGTVLQAGAGLLPPAPLAPATASVLLTLLDADTPLWLGPELADAADWLRFHSGAPLTGMAEARFLCARVMPPLPACDAGTDLAPEDSATLVLQVDALDEGTALRLSGPGIEHAAVLRVAGLPRDFARQWAGNQALYPRGVDLVLCAGRHVCALPRSTRVEEG